MGRTMLRSLAAFVAVLAIAAVVQNASAASATDQIPVSYNLKVTIDPVPGDIAVRGEIVVPLKSQDAREIVFGLHETFAITRLTVNGHKADFRFQSGDYTPLNPATRDVVVRLPSGIPQNGKRTVKLGIDYSGHLRELPEFGSVPWGEKAMDDQVNARLVELANYSSWYPQFFPFSYPLRIAMEVSLPQGWIAVCSGKKVDERAKEGRAVTRWSSPKDFDIVISAAPNYRLTSANLPDGSIAIYSTQMPEALVAREAQELTAVMTLFTSKLGETTIPGGVVRHVYSPMRKGQGRAGIARPGLIVTSEGRALEALAADSKSSLLQDIAHEIGHFWWNFGAGQGDWINEAFAEYFSAVAVEKVVSDEQFESVLERYRQQVRSLPADTPPLASVPFEGKYFVVRYFKGALMVDFLRRSLGDEKFFQSAHAFFEQYRGKSIGTAEFRGFWRERMGEHTAAFDLWLDTGGGLPTEGEGNLKAE